MPAGPEPDDDLPPLDFRSWAEYLLKTRQADFAKAGGTGSLCNLHQLCNYLMTEATNADGAGEIRVDPGSILNAAGKRDKALAWEALEWLYGRDKGWVERSAEAYLDMKRAEAQNLQPTS